MSAFLLANILFNKARAKTGAYIHSRFTGSLIKLYFHMYNKKCQIMPHKILEDKNKYLNCIAHIISFKWSSCFKISTTNWRGKILSYTD